MASNHYGAKLRILVWKCWKLQLRQPAMLATDIGLIVVYATTLALVRLKIPPRIHGDVSRFSAFGPVKPLAELRIDDPIIAWTAGASADESLRSEAWQVIKGAFAKENITLIEFTGEPEMTAFLVDESNLVIARKTSVICGMILENTSGSGKLCSQGLKLTLRFPGEMRQALAAEAQAEAAMGTRRKPDDAGPRSWHTERLTPQHPRPGPHTHHALYYLYEGFLTVQYLISGSIIKYCGRDDSLAQMLSRSQVKLREFSYPSYVEDPLISYMEYFLPVLFYVCLANQRVSTIRAITSEKEQQLKEVMKIMGMANFLYWTAWFVKTMTYMSIYAVLLLLFLKADFLFGIAVLPKSDSSLVFFFLVLYMMATTSFCCMISAFFTDATKASLIGRLLWAGSLLPYMTFVKHYSSVSLTSKLLAALCLNTGMALGAMLIVKTEMNGNGMKWSNACKPVSPDDDLTLVIVMGVLLADTAIYMLVALYVDAVYAGKFGISRPWNFFCSASYWLGESSRVEEEMTVGEKGVAEVAAGDPRREATHLLPAAQMFKLSKVFDKNRVAVSDFNLTLYHNQITVLLGHNGCGKSTVIAMLAGIYTPSSGRVLVHSIDMVKNVSSARRSIGICLQEDVLFKELTVRDHLHFFCKLKGLRGDKAEQEVTKYLICLDLVPKAHEKAKRLSPGMRRKLVAAIALCGRSRLVLLDEPTVGMDPAARRLFWELLQAEKRGRAVLLSTQSMREADALGDRIAIMARGRLHVCDSPVALKKRYDAGSRLVLEKGPRCDVASVVDLLRIHAAALPPPDELGSELSFRLEQMPPDTVRRTLRALEDAQETLDVRAYALSTTTMDEVYFKVSEEVREWDESQMEPKSSSRAEAAEEEEEQELQVTGGALLGQRVRALCLKKMLLQLRDWVLFALHCALPAFFLVAFNEGSRTSLSAPHDPPALAMRLQDYPGVEATVSISREANTSGDEELWNAYESYKKIVSTSSTIRELSNQSDPERALDLQVLSEMLARSEGASRSLLVGASFVAGAHPVVTAWFDSHPMHSVPLALNLLMNAFMDSSNVSLSVVNSPLPLKKEFKLKVSSEQTQNNVVRAASFAMTFVASYFVLLPVTERAAKAKLLQLMAGASPLCFWLVQLALDALLQMLPSFLVVVTLLIYQADGVASAVHLGHIFLILIFFGWAILPLTYLFSFSFKQPSTGYNVVMTIYLYFGLGLFLGMEFLLLRAPSAMLSVVSWFLLLLPHYCFADALMHCIQNYVYHKFCENRVRFCDTVHEDFCCPGKCPKSGCLKYEHNPYSIYVPGLGRNILFFIFTGFLYLFIIFLIEYRYVKFLRYTSPKNEEHAKSDGSEEHHDSDVMEEKRRIHCDENVIKENNVVLRDLTKYYRKLLAIDRICLAVKEGEIFGLLGTNGAGKTTLFKILAGDLLNFGGEGFINGYSLKAALHKARKNMEYCPQSDALLCMMTGRETLCLYAMLRGVPRSRVKDVVYKMANTLLFTEYLDVKVKKYSGGTRRKLSAAIALMGSPPLVVLDEPTAGLDPMCRRSVWNLVAEVQRRGSCVVLTTHSMEECEALCGRVAIMVNGTLRCLGTLPHLKSKFASGLMLQIKVIFPAALEPVKGFVHRNLPDAELRDEYLSTVKFFIPNTEVSYSVIYANLENSKEELQIEDYRLGQASLEEMFLSFVKEQHP